MRMETKKYKHTVPFGIGLLHTGAGNRRGSSFLQISPKVSNNALPRGWGAGVGLELGTKDRHTNNMILVLLKHLYPQPLQGGGGGGVCLWFDTVASLTVCIPNQ